MTFGSRDQGVELSGTFDQLHWNVTLQNGIDNQADDYAVSGRVRFNFMGEGVGDVEGAYQGPNEMAGTVALAIFDDNSVPGTSLDRAATLIEAHVVTSEWSAGAEVMDADDGFGDATPIMIYGTYMLTPDEWEAGLRFTDGDDAADTTTIEAGFNKYMDGHDLKWSIGYATTDSNSVELDGDRIQVQLTLAF